MIEHLSDTPAHLLAFRAEDRIEAGDIARTTERLDDMLREHPRVSLFADLTAMSGMTPGALWKNTRYSTGHSHNLRRYYRVALVTEQRWLRVVTDLERPLAPSVDLRTFTPAERDEALRWAAEAPPSGEPAHAYEEIPTSASNVVAYAVRGPVTGAGVDTLAERLDANYAAHETPRTKTCPCSTASKAPSASASIS